MHSAKKISEDLLDLMNNPKDGLMNRLVGSLEQMGKASKREDLLCLNSCALQAKHDIEMMLGYTNAIVLVTAKELNATHPHP